jgi:hypothetical protein
LELKEQAFLHSMVRRTCSQAGNESGEFDVKLPYFSGGSAWAGKRDVGLLTTPVDVVAMK